MTNRKRRPHRGDPDLRVTRPAEFFAQHPYFTVGEYLLHRSPNAAMRALEYHRAQGRLLSVRKGTYLSSDEKRRPDPFLLGTRLVSGAISHATALWYHRLLPPQKLVTVVTRGRRLADFRFAGVTYRSVEAPRNIGGDPIGTFDIKYEQRRGLWFFVHGIDRALVDCLDRLDLAPSLEMLWEIFRARDDMDMQGMVEHAVKIGNRVTCARLGLFIEHHPERTRKQPDLRVLKENIPKTSALMDPGHSPAGRCRNWPKWKLLIPKGLFRTLLPDN